YSDEQIIQDPKFQHYCEHYSSGIQQYIERMEANKECVSEELELYNRIIKTRSNIYIEAFRSMLKGPLYSYLSSNDKNVIEANANFSLEDISIMHQIFYYNQSLNQESKIEKASDEYLKNFINSPDNQFTEDVDVRKIIKEAREQANEEAIKKYNSLVIFDGNVDFSKEHVCLDLSQLEGQMMSIFINEGDLEEGRFIVFDPYASPDANYDVHLRHELRHSLTSSISINKDGIVIVKVGNNLFYYLEDNLIGSENTDFNEYFTQKKALENTRVAYQKGIYVLTSPGTKQPLSPTSSYDEYLPEFDKIYNLLSKEARKSQIELTNENLYREISAISIKDLESKIFYREVLDVDILKELIG
ncbi:MAG: hypothetical protein K2I70_00645, partial [Bacilli bacterium]|nr:hypothetical protein [Bacilli bacterium]